MDKIERHGVDLPRPISRPSSFLALILSSFGLHELLKSGKPTKAARSYIDDDLPKIVFNTQWIPVEGPQHLTLMQRLSLAVPWTPWPSANSPEVAKKPSASPWEHGHAGPRANIEDPGSSSRTANKIADDQMAPTPDEVEPVAPVQPLAQRPRKKKRVRRYHDINPSSSTVRKTNIPHSKRMRQYELEMRTRWLYCIVYAGLLSTSLIVFGSLAGMATTASTSGRIVAVVASIIFGILFFWSVGLLFLTKAQNPELLAARRSAGSRGASSPSSIAETEGTLRPTQPIRIVHDGDVDEAEFSGQAPRDDMSAKTVAKPPPIYGVWRGSVRADPKLLYWQKVEDNHDNEPGRNVEPASPPYEEFPIYMTPSPKHHSTSFSVHPALRGIPLTNLTTGIPNSSTQTREPVASTSKNPRPSSADTNYPRPPVYNSSIISPRKADPALAMLSPDVYVPAAAHSNPHAGDAKTHAALRGDKLAQAPTVVYDSPKKSVGKGRPALFGEVVEVV